MLKGRVASAIIFGLCLVVTAGGVASGQSYVSQTKTVKATGSVDGYLGDGAPFSCVGGESFIRYRCDEEGNKTLEAFGASDMSGRAGMKGSYVTTCNLNYTNGGGIGFSVKARAGAVRTVINITAARLGEWNSKICKVTLRGTASHPNHAKGANGSYSGSLTAADCSCEKQVPTPTPTPTQCPVCPVCPNCDYKIPVIP